MTTQITEENKAKAADFKNKGNAALKQNDFDGAIKYYTQAIEIDPTQAVFYSNRAQAEIKTEAYGVAVSDASKAIELDGNYIKGYYRRAVAHAAILQYTEALKDLKIVMAKAPGDKLAKQYYNEYNKILKSQAFEKAIRSDDAPSAISLVNIDTSSISKNPFSKENQLLIKTVGHDKETKEPEIEINGITDEFIDEMIRIFKKGEQLPRPYAFALIVAAYQLFRKEPTMVEISLPDVKKNESKFGDNSSKSNLQVLEGAEKITVCGDTHGQFYDLVNIFETYGKVSSTHAYLFNGDFVDRGSWSTEVAFLLYALKIQHPNRLFINRGNHETNDMNKMYGFEGECKRKYNELIYQVFSQSFGALPLATLIGNDYLVMHGGLFSDDSVQLADIKKLDRFKSTQPPKEGIAMELLWTDPQPYNGRGPSKRGIGMQFGPDVTERFCLANDLKAVIRSHEVRMEGYEKEHNGKLITVFSAPNYCDSQGNKGACIEFAVGRESGELELEFHQFNAVPHPNIKPMAY